MAARSFLLSADHEESLVRLTAGVKYPDSNIAPAREAFSLWLEERLLARLNEFGDFLALQPIRLGSWARHELTPKSDIDLLFLGPEAKVKDFVGQAFKSGLKLRARTPEDLDDWTKGVEPFDVLALHVAAAFDDETQARLIEQRGNLEGFRSQIVSSIRVEREERRRRQDSIATYLEPNLKFGSGGLRDIEQALAIRKLAAEVFVSVDPYPFATLHAIKNELLYLRSYLHLLGSGDVLTAQDQLELVKRLGLATPRDLMTRIQSELERGSFYADWAVAYCTARPKQRRVERSKSLAEVVERLKASDSILHQFEIRRVVNDWFHEVSAAEQGKVLQKALAEPLKDSFIVALHRTRLLEGFVPDLKKIRGLVQHDHYHRFTADAHLVQTLREVVRVQHKKGKLGHLAALTRGLDGQDWWVLKLTALFHDLAKGRKGDHSTEGAKLVEQYLSGWKYPPALIDDVAWMVENHLLLSTAAFRQNPNSQSTWKRLFERGVKGRRLKLLALFTALDIRATNPEAWTEWKAKLLIKLVESLESKPARDFEGHLAFANKKGWTHAQEWLTELDPALFEALLPRVLVADLEAAQLATDDLPVKVVQDSASGNIWVRFHRKRDKAGVLLTFVRHLFGLGLSIKMSSVHTLPGIGVYDWFCLQTDKSLRQVSKWMSLPRTDEVVIPNVRLQAVELMAQDDKEWVLSFRGRDQRGLLLACAQAIVDEKLSIRWAKAHTWGQQIDDVFGVRPFGELDRVLVNLRNKFVT